MAQETLRGTTKTCELFFPALFMLMFIYHAVRSFNNCQRESVENRALNHMPEITQPMQTVLMHAEHSLAKTSRAALLLFRGPSLFRSRPRVLSDSPSS